MAVVLDPLEGTEKDPNAQQGNANNNQPLQEVKMGGGDSSSIGGQPSAAANAPKPVALAQRAPTSSGQFTNIQKYMKANQGYAGGQGLGGAIAGRIQGTAEQAKNVLGQNKQALESEMAKQQAGFAKAPDVQQSFQALRNSMGSDQDKARLQGAIKQEYTGPTEFQDLTQLRATGRDLNTLGKQTTSETGRQALLQRYFNKPTYNQGQQKLDTLLLGDQGQLAKLSAARKQAATFDPMLGKQSEAAQAAANALKQETKATRDLTRNLGQEAYTGELGELDTTVGAAAKAYKDKVEQLRRSADFNKADLSNIQDVYDILGGNINRADIISKYGTASNLADINRTNADPRQAALVNYFSNLVGGGDVVQNIAEATPTAEQVTYGVDPYTNQIAQTARMLQDQYARARQAQVDASNRYYQAAAQSGDLGSVDWQTADQMGQANEQAYAIENQLAALREQLTGNRAASGFYGGQMARDTAAKMNEARKNALQLIAQRAASKAGTVIGNTNNGQANIVIMPDGRKGLYSRSEKDAAGNPKFLGYQN